MGTPNGVGALSRRRSRRLPGSHRGSPNALTTWSRRSLRTASASSLARASRCWNPSGVAAPQCDPGPPRTPSAIDRDLCNTRGAHPWHYYEFTVSTLPDGRPWNRFIAGTSPPQTRYCQRMRIGTRAALSRWVAPLWPVTLLAMLIGAGIGALILHPPRTHTAACVIRMDPPVDPNEIMTNQQPFPGVAPDFLASQIAYLNSVGFLDSVATHLRQPTLPTLYAEQGGKTNLVTLTGIAGTADDARKVVDAATQTYSEHIKKVDDLRTSQSLDAIRQVIDRLEGAMRQRGQPLTKPGDDLGQLYLQRTELQVQLARPPGVVIAEPTADRPTQGKLSMPALGAALGGLAGGLIALTSAQLWRSRAGIVTATDLVDEAPLLRPVVPLSGAVKPATARTLYAQLSPRDPGRIVVIGTSSESGTATVVQYLAFAARECGPVVTDSVFDPCADDADESLRGLVPGKIISDGGDLGSSPNLIEFAERATHVVVVARIGFDSNKDLQIAVRAMLNEGVPVSVVYARGRPWAVQHGLNLSRPVSTISSGR